MCLLLACLRIRSPIGIYLSYRFARTIALKTLRWKTKPTRTETVNSMGHEACKQSRSFERARLHRQAPIANSNSNHAPPAPCVHARKIKLCAGNRSNRNSRRPSWKEVLLHRVEHPRLSYLASNNCIF